MSCDSHVEKVPKGARKVTNDELVRMKIQFMLKHYLSIPDKNVRTSEQFDALSSAISQYYETKNNNSFAESKMQIRCDVLEQDQKLMGNGILHKNDEFGVHSIGPYSLMLYTGEYCTMQMNCVIRYGKLDGYVNCEMYTEDGYSIRCGVTKNGKLHGFCDVHRYYDEYSVQYKGIFEDGVFQSGNVVKYKFDDSYDKDRDEYYEMDYDERKEKNIQRPEREDYKIILEQHAGVQGEFELKLPEFEFDMSQMRQTSPIYYVESIENYARVYGGCVGCGAEPGWSIC